MADIKARIEELSGLIEEFGLESATLKGDDWKVSFSRTMPSAPVAVAAEAGSAPATPVAPARAPKAKAAEPAGRPINSPMTGIYYSSPSPGSPPFVKPGDSVSAGEVVGLIEAMKVFNEITAPFAGKVVAVKAENGQLVQPGETLVVLE